MGNSYVNTFFDWNQKYFETGKPVTIYTRNIDYFANQEKMRSMHAYLVSSKFVDQNEDINDWHHEFLEAVNQNTSEWMSNGGGVRYRSQVQWTDAGCSNTTNAACDAT